MGNFYDDNALRDYPFLPGTTGDPDTNLVNSLPYGVILDAAFTVILPEGAAGLPTLTLHTFSHTRLLEILFLETEFRLSFDDGTFLPLFVLFQSTAQRYTKLTSEAASPEGSFLSGYFIFGSLDAFQGRPVDTALDSREPVSLEPSCLTVVRGTGVTGVLVGNANRTRATYPAGCHTPAGGDDTQEYPVTYPDGMDAERPYWKQPYDANADTEEERLIQSQPLILREGYNCSLSFRANENAIRIVPDLGAGMGVPAAELPLGFYTEGSVIHKEVYADDRSRYDGAVRIEDTIRMIQATPGPSVSMTGTNGIQVTAEDPHTVRVRDTGLRGSNELC
jgi:hypothetical protein